MRAWRLLLRSTMAMLAAAISAEARTITVTNLNESGTGSLRQAIADSASGDTIAFSVTGTINLTSGEFYINHNLTITGPGAPWQLVINRSSSASQFRIFYFDNGTWSLSNVTVSNGSDSVEGGGIYNGGGNLTLNNCVISGNTAPDGGGIKNDQALTISNCTFQGNANSEDMSGGALLNNGTLSLRSSTFASNSGKGNQSATALANYGNSDIVNCTFANNVGPLTITHFNGFLTIFDCTFSGNINLNYDVLTIDLGYDNNLKIGGCIFDEFFIGNSVAVQGNHDGDQGYNLCTDNGGLGGYFLNGNGTPHTGDQLNASTGLDPSGLQYNGGYTNTIALTAGSLAIDRGNSFGVAEDQRGEPRTVGSAADIGAYEAPADPLQNYHLHGAYVVTTLEDHDDGLCSVNDCSLREAIERTNLGRVGNVFLGVGGTIALQSGLDITASVNITGIGAGTNILSGRGINRIFFISSGVSNMSGLTIIDGNQVDSNNHGEPRRGGAVYNQASVTFQSCQFSSNGIIGASNVNNGGAGGAGQGGAIYNTGSAAKLFLVACTFAGNFAQGSAGNNYTSQNGLFAAGGMGGAGQGGAVFNDTGASLTIQDCTFASNGATGGAAGTGSVGPSPAGGGDGTGAAIFNQGNMHITSGTISGNTGSGGNGAKSGPFEQGPRGSGIGGVSAVGGQSTFLNTMIAANSGNTAPDAQGTFVSTGYNLIGIADQSSGFTNTGDQLGSGSAALNPHLGPLQNNGGSTDTMALLNGTTAHDAGSDTNNSQDQRGYPRRDAIGTDIGAVQMNLLGGPDSDGDGMSDDFERFYGFNPNDPGDANIDSDGDGLTNLQEFQAGTNPHDPSSRVAITSITRNGNAATIVFNIAVPGKTYRLERATSLTPPVSWTALNDQALNGPPAGPLNFNDPNASGPACFYRVVLPP